MREDTQCLTSGLKVSVTFDERGYIGSAPELRLPVMALSLGGLRRKIEALMMPMTFVSCCSSTDSPNLFPHPSPADPALPSAKALGKQHSQPLVALTQHGPGGPGSGRPEAHCSTPLNR